MAVMLPSSTSRDSVGMNTEASQEQIAAARVLFIIASRITPESQKFANWVLSATGAAVALLLSNLSALVGIASTASIKWGIGALIVSILVGLVTRYNAASIETALRVQEEIDALMLRMAEERTEQEKRQPGSPAFNAETFQAEMWKSLLQPALWMAKRGDRLARAGDHLAPIRMLAKLSQFNGRLIFFQFLLIALGPLLIVCGVRS